MTDAMRAELAGMLELNRELDDWAIDDMRPALLQRTDPRTEETRMPPRKTGLPVCQHILLGLQLLRAREQLMDAAQTVYGGYAKTSKAAVAAHRITEDVDKLRAELDNQSAGERFAKEDWVPNIYYGANAEMWAKTVLPIWRRHQEANPPCCAGMPEPSR